MVIHQALGRLICAYCGHCWSEWMYTAEDNCTRIRKCTRCSAEESSGPEHVWSNWSYENTGECDQVRTCSRCDSVEKRTQHDWGNWEYEKPGECGQLKTCSRCSAQNRQGPEHDSSYFSQGKCSRCGGVNPVGKQSSAAKDRDYSFDPCSEIACCGMGCEPG